jgi:hypothetical protein
MKTGKIVNSLTLILVFFLSVTISIKIGYSVGVYSCWKIYSWITPDIPPSEISRIDESEKARIRREAGLNAIRLTKEILGENATEEDLKKAQKDAEEIADTMIEMGQMIEVLRRAKIPPAYLEYMSGITGSAIFFIIAIFFLANLRNIILKKLILSPAFAPYVHDCKLIGGMKYIKIIVRSIISFIKIVWKKYKESKRNNMSNSIIRDSK